MALSSLGIRSSLFQRCRIYLADDRLEEITYTLSHLEVGRLFFDEATCATVHRVRDWPSILLVSILGTIPLIFAASGKAGAGVWVAGLLGLAGVLAYLIARPVHRLVVRTPDQQMQTNLPRGPRKREARIRKLVEAIEAYQTKNASPLPSELPRA